MIPSCSTNCIIENCSRPEQMVNSTPGTRAVLNPAIVSSVMSEWLSSSVPSRSQAISFWIAATALRAVDHAALADRGRDMKVRGQDNNSISYTHLRAHETRHDLVCRLLLEKKKKK